MLRSSVLTSRNCKICKILGLTWITWQELRETDKSRRQQNVKTTTRVKLNARDSNWEWATRNKLIVRAWLTLIRLTSKKACQDWGGVSDTPPSYLSSGASQSSKNTFFWKLRIFPVYKSHFQNFFFPKSVKKSKNYRFSIIWGKNAKNFNFCNFWATSTIYTSKESIFHVEFKFCHEKYFLFQKNSKK